MYEIGQRKGKKIQTYLQSDVPSAAVTEEAAFCLLPKKERKEKRA